MTRPEARPQNSSGPLLETKGLTVRFGGLRAVKDLDLTVHQGEILSLIGPNGAGKTTVFNLITGLYRADGGDIFFKGKKITDHKAHQIAASGMARTFQNTRLFPEMTCLENIMAGLHSRSSAGLWSSLFRSSAMRKEEYRIRQKAEARLRQVNLWAFQNELSKNIPYGSQRMIEIARAIAAEPALLILDEPSCGLNPQETENLMTFLQDLIRREGLTIFLIEHDMNLVMGISDRVVVMDQGRKIAEGTPREIYDNPEVIETYLGYERAGNE